MEIQEIQEAVTFEVVMMAENTFHMEDRCKSDYFLLLTCHRYSTALHNA